MVSPPASIETLPASVACGRKSKSLKLSGLRWILTGRINEFNRKGEEVLKIEKAKVLGTKTSSSFHLTKIHQAVPAALNTSHRVQSKDKKQRL